MSIVSSEVTLNRPDISVFNRRIKELHIDHLGHEFRPTWNHVFTTDPADYPGDDAGYQAALSTEYTPTLALHATWQEETSSNQEINQWISDMGQGLDPWHTSPFVNVVPDYNTWDTAASESLKHWLKMDDPQELLNCELSIGSTSNGDIDDLLVSCGSTWSRTDLTGEIQEAVNAQVRLDAYIPSVVE